ncbi:MAG TPA: UDP-glucose/GDP-mannose dehydrogenase family protein [Mycobacteriales bacterium]|nr:UDP-glucose/GDP-mannose dehydrogenase family protein [Mycobacteriales bacterium]
MTRVAVVGTGYVGTVTAVCFAWLGHEVVGFDLDASRVGQLAAGQLPFVEPGLPSLLSDTLATGRLSFVDDPAAVGSTDVIFLCVGTPTGPGGMPDMSQVGAAAHAVAQHLRDSAIVVNKSTVPVGSGNWVRTIIEEALPAGRRIRFGVVSNPEFLREGAAVEDFLFPDRIVLGGENGSLATVARLYDRVLRQDFPGARPARLPALVQTTLPSAEMVKYAANAFLATKISFANEIATMCELVGADAGEVLPAIGADSRIGPRFLQHGLGWGGSCFGKDVAALIATGEEYGHCSPILRAAVEVNEAQRAAVLRKLQMALKVLKGRRVAVLGLAFKPGTDDLRDSPAVDVIRRLHAAGAVVSAYDPVVKHVPALDDLPVRISSDVYDTADRADAVVVATEWAEFADLDLHRLAEHMSGRVVLDARSVLDRQRAAAAGLALSGFGW